MRKLVIATIVLLFAAVASAETVFEYKVDRFEVTGNLPGSAVDEFDGGGLHPWVVTYGTVNEAGGYLVLSNPGFPMNPPGYTNIVMERSDAYAPSVFPIQEGAGDATATSTWAPVIPEAPGGFYAMTLDYPLSSTEREMMAISVANLSNIVARNLLGSGAEGGLQINQLRWVYEYDAGTGDLGDGAFVETDWYAFDEEDVTGDIVVRLDFDDTTNQAVTSFSLDGGTVWLTPFSPMSSSIPDDEPAIWMLIGDPMEYVGPPVPAVSCGHLSMLGLGFVGTGAVFLRRRKSRE